MAHHTLYAYVEGREFDAIAEDLVDNINAFIASRKWVCSNVHAVNQRRDSDWELGLNVALPDPGAETPGWFADIESVVLFLASIYAQTAQTFAVGIYDHVGEFSEDLFYVHSSEPDLEYLRKIIGVGDIT